MITRLMLLTASSDLSLSVMVGKVVRNYVEFRAAQKQALIAEKNLDSHKKPLSLCGSKKNWANLLSWIWSGQKDWSIQQNPRYQSSSGRRIMQG